MDGTFLHGRSFRLTVQGLLVALDGEKAATTSLGDPLGGIHLGVHGVDCDHRPVRGEGACSLVCVSSCGRTGTDDCY